MPIGKRLADVAPSDSRDSLSLQSRWIGSVTVVSTEGRWGSALSDGRRIGAPARRWLRVSRETLWARVRNKFGQTQPSKRRRRASPLRHGPEQHEVWLTAPTRRGCG